MRSDAELVEECRAGSAEAIQALVARFESEVLALALRVLRHRHDAEDVAQESFLRVFRSLHHWDPARPLRPWVLGIAMNRCRTQLERRRRLPTPSEFLAEVPGREAAGPPGELVAALGEVLADLRPDYREVFVLFHEHGLAYDAIAERVGRPVGTVKTWLHRARVDILQELVRRGLVPAATPTQVTP